jgi:hypothetical protein
MRFDIASNIDSESRKAQRRGVLGSISMLRFSPLTLNVIVGIAVRSEAINDSG